MLRLSQDKEFETNTSSLVGLVLVDLVPVIIAWQIVVSVTDILYSVLPFIMRTSH